MDGIGQMIASSTGICSGSDIGSSITPFDGVSLHMHGKASGAKGRLVQLSQPPGGETPENQAEQQSRRRGRHSAKPDEYGHR